MPDEINFLPEKEKEIKEKQQAKKAKPGVKFHTPNFEEPKKNEESGAFPTVMGLLGKVKASLKKIFKFKKKKAPEIDSKKPAQLTAKPPIPGDKIKLKKTAAETGLKPSTPSKKADSTPAPPARPITGVPEDLGGDFSEVDVNLMPWQDPSIKRYRILGIVLVVLSILVVVIWGTILRINNKSKATTIEQLTNSIEIAEQQLVEINTELFSQSNDIALRQREFVKLFTTIPRWSKFLTWLEVNTHKSVYFNDIRADEDGFSLPVNAPDYDTAIQQWLAFRSATTWVESIVVSGIAASSDEDKLGANFDAEIKFKEGALQVSKGDLQE